MYQFEIQEAIDSQVGSETVRHLYRLWQRYHEAAGGLPSLDDLGPRRLEWCAANLMLVEPLGEDDFLYRFYGPAIAQAAGFDMTGKRASEFRSDVGEFFREKYHQCLATGRPLYTVHRGTHAPTVHTWERLLLPVREGDRELVVTLNQPKVFRHEFLQGVLESTSNGILFAAALIARDAPTDFHVLSANSAAARLLGMHSAPLEDRRLGEVLPPPLRDRVVALCREIHATGNADTLEVHGMYNGVSRVLQASGARVGDGVTLVLSDVTRLRAQERILEELRVELAREQEARNRLEEELRAMIDKDALAGVLGRRSFMKALEVEIAKATRHGRPLSVLLLELDGYDGATEPFTVLGPGDVLVSAARLCQGMLRQCDQVGHVAAARFAACLPETGSGGADEVAARIAEAIAVRFRGEPMLSRRATASTAVAQFQPGNTAEQLLARAAGALREVRRRSRGTPA